MHSPSSLAKECNDFKRETLTKHLQSNSYIYCRDCYLGCSGKSKALTLQEVLPDVFDRKVYCQKEKLVLKNTTVLLHSKLAVFYQSQD